MTTTATSPHSAPILPGDPRPIAMLASTRQTPVRAMTAVLTRLYGPGLLVTTQGKRTVWSLTTIRKQPAVPATATPGRTTR